MRKPNQLLFSKLVPMYHHGYNSSAFTRIPATRMADRHNITVSCDLNNIMAGPGSLEEELINVVKTLETLQVKYIRILESDTEEDDPGSTLDDYKTLSGKMIEWIEQCSNVTR